MQRDRLGRDLARVGREAGVAQPPLGLLRAAEREAATPVHHVGLERAGVVEHRRHEEDLLVGPATLEVRQRAPVEERAVVVLEHEAREQLRAGLGCLGDHRRVRRREVVEPRAALGSPSDPRREQQRRRSSLDSHDRGHVARPLPAGQPAVGAARPVQ